MQIGTNLRKPIQDGVRGLCTVLKKKYIMTFYKAIKNNTINHSGSKVRDGL